MATSSALRRQLLGTIVVRSTPLWRPFPRIARPYVQSHAVARLSRPLGHRFYSKQIEGPGKGRSQGPFSNTVLSWLALWLTATATTAGVTHYYFPGLFTDALRVQKHYQSPTYEEDSAYAHLPLSGLLRRYVVYALCSSPWLIESSVDILEWSRTTRVPLVNKTITWLMKHTFVAQFVGGESAEACKEQIRLASQQTVGTILAYSAEVDDRHVTTSTEDDSLTQTQGVDGAMDSYLHMDKVQEIIHSIRVAGECNEEERQLTSSSIGVHRADSILIAVKLSGLLRNANVLERASAILVPREQFADPPATMPPLYAEVAKRPNPEVMIPTQAMTASDAAALKALWKALQDIAESAKANGNIRILIDAEYSWYQPCIDALFESCAQKFNRLSGSEAPAKANVSWWTRGTNSIKDSEPNQHQVPLIYNTYQAYLRRTPVYLSMSLERARLGNYSLGVKLVRGAYIDVEAAMWQQSIVPTPPGMDKDTVQALQHVQRGEWRDPFWPSKSLTDECYDSCASMLIKRVATELQSGPGLSTDVAVLFAGHNWASAMGVIAQMVQTGLAREREESDDKFTVDRSLVASRGTLDAALLFDRLQLAPGVRGRIHLGQLYGMADDLTYAIQRAFDHESGGDGPHIALKYMPYGDFDLVLPYLTRRAQENKSVVGGGRARRERALVVDEIKKIFGGKTQRPLNDEEIRTFMAQVKRRQEANTDGKEHVTLRERPLQSIPV